MNIQPFQNRTTVRHYWKSCVILPTIFLMGCQELGLQFPPPHGGQMVAPYTLDTIFTPTPQDSVYLATLGKEAEKRLTNCQEIPDCDTAHFFLALALLPENRDLALHHFQKVAISPVEGPLARSSRVWIWILEETNPTHTHSSPRTNLAQGLLQAVLTNDLTLARQPLSHHSSERETRALLDRIGYDVKIKTLTEQVQGLAHDVTSFHNQSSAMQNLRKELEARDKKVEELSLQLNALRRIDQELKEKSTPTRLSETLIPAKDERAATP